jgi:tetratricopeptide (TPR) repeat protein
MAASVVGACVRSHRGGNFVEAIAHYSEAIKRNPSDAVYYCNRAAARTKVMDFTSAMEDCNVALKLNPSYVKAYSRKGALEQLMKEYHKVCVGGVCMCIGVWLHVSPVWPRHLVSFAAAPRRCVYRWCRRLCRRSRRTTPVWR